MWQGQIPWNGHQRKQFMKLWEQNLTFQKHGMLAKKSACNELNQPKRVHIVDLLCLFRAHIWTPCAPYAWHWTRSLNICPANLHFCFSPLLPLMVHLSSFLEWMMLLYAIVECHNTIHHFIWYGLTTKGLYWVLRKPNKIGTVKTICTTETEYSQLNMRLLQGPEWASHFSEVFWISS